MRMTQVAILLTLAIAGIDPDANAASIDRGKFSPADQPYMYYLSLSSQRSPQERDRLANVLRSLVPSYSSRTYLGEQLPVRISENLMRIDTRGLGWETALPHVLANYYPWRPDLKRGQYPYTFRGDWFAASIPDAIQTGDSQFRLIFENNPPKTTADWRKRWKTNEDPQFLFQFHEAESGVGVNPDRNVKQFPTATRGGLYATEDSEQTIGDKDPGNYGKNGKFDAGEEIALGPKQYNGTNAVAMFFWLANGKGERQFVAPSRIVTDHNNLRSTEIGLGDCRACHVEGLRPLNVNGFAGYVTRGARVAADKHTQRLIDQQYQAGMAQQIEADNKLYAKFLEICNGLTPAQDAKAYEAVVRAYDAPVTLEQAARERHMSKQELKDVLGYYSARYSLSRRLADLAQDGAISRAQWQNEQHNVYAAEVAWGKK